jgi:hypothetical protein
MQHIHIPDEETQKKLEDVIQVLATSTFKDPPKQLGYEESLVLKQLERLAFVYSDHVTKGAGDKVAGGKVPGILKEPRIKDPKDEDDFIFSIEAIKKLTSVAQLTLIAEKISDQYLGYIENILKTTDVKFTNNQGNSIELKTLYNKCRAYLSGAGKTEPKFGDVLLRMYTTESPFFEKLNAILGGYEKIDSTKKEERILAFLISVALHKAGLEKKAIEIQTTPGIVYRGQGFGLDVIEEKFRKTKQLLAEGKLSTLNPEKINEIDVSFIVGKKALSTTSSLKATDHFVEEAKKKGNQPFVLHITNPATFADFYDVKNISAVKSEDEFITRFPDDIAMIVTNISTDAKGIPHIYVSLIRSEKVLLKNSTKLEEIKGELNDLVDRALKSNTRLLSKLRGVFGTDYSGQRAQLLEQFKTRLQNERHFVKSGYGWKLLRDLYTTKPDKDLETIFAEINSKFSELCAAVANLKVLPDDHDPVSKAKSQKDELKSFQQGISIWLKNMKQSNPQEAAGWDKLSDSLDIVRNIESSYQDLRSTIENILVDVKSKPHQLYKNLSDMLDLLDKIEPKVKKSPDDVELASEALKNELKEMKEPDSGSASPDSPKL